MFLFTFFRKQERKTTKKVNSSVRRLRIRSMNQKKCEELEKKVKHSKRRRMPKKKHELNVADELIYRSELKNNFDGFSFQQQQKKFYKFFWMNVFSI